MICELLLIGYVCAGALAYAPIMDNVAIRRYENEWGVFHDPANFQVLLGLDDCRLLGKRGFLRVGSKYYRALVVDCQQAVHFITDNMKDRKLLADINLPEFNHRFGLLRLYGND